MAGKSKYQYILSYNGSSETLTINPAGWDKIGLKRVRSRVYHSISRSLTLSLRFANKRGGGFTFIKNAYDTSGIYANIEVTINKRNPANNRYELYYNGKLDMSPARFIISRSYIEAPIVDNEKVQRLFSRDEINYNVFDTVSTDGISVTPFANNYSVNLPPIDIILEAKFTCNSYDNRRLAGIAYYTYFNNKVDQVNQLEERVTIDGGERIYTNSTDLTIDLTVIIESVSEWSGYSDGITAITTQLNVYRDTGTLFGDINFKQYVAIYDTNNFLFEDIKTGEYTFILPPGYYIILRNKVEGCCGPVNIKDDYTITIKERYNGYEQTSTNCLFPHEAFTRLIQLSTSETNTDKLFYSELMGRLNSEFVTYSDNGLIAYDAIFSGLMSRKFPNSPLNISLRNLFQTFDAIYNLGFAYDYVNDRFYVDNKEAFFDSNYFMFDLGEVNDLQITLLSDGYFSKIMAGYDNNGDYEELQGAYEFNNKREYSISTPVKEEKSIQSKYRADSVGIEITRKKQYVENPSEDTNQDNDIFIVRTDGADAVIDSTVTGFNGCEAYYNSMLTPRQNIIRWGNAILPSLYKNNGQIQLNKTDKQFELYVNGVDENSNISQSELGSPLFIPELYTFEAKLSASDLETLVENPHGFITFAYLGVQYEGYIDEVEIEDNNNKANFKLIAKAPSELGNFIFYDGNDFIFYDDNDLIFFN